MSGISSITLELGKELLPLIDPDEGEKLKKRIESVSQHIHREWGFKTPPVAIEDNSPIQPDTYTIKIYDLDTAKGDVMMNRLLAIGPEDKLREVEGKATSDPTYGLPGRWISAESRDDAESLGCMIFDPVSVIATHLTETIRSNIADFLGLQEVQNILHDLHQTHPAVVEEFHRAEIGRVTLRIILRNLLRERVSLRNIVLILESVIENYRITQDREILTEMARTALSKFICNDYIDDKRVINVFSIDPQLEQLIAESVKPSEMGSYLALDPNMGQNLLTLTGDHINLLEEKGLQPVILVTPQIRPAFKKFTGRSFPKLAVLSWNEIPPGVKVNSVRSISFD